METIAVTGMAIALYWAMTVGFGFWVVRGGAAACR